MQDNQDEVLQELRSAVDPIITKIDDDMDSERAVLMIGTKEVTDKSGEYVGVETYFDVTGDQGLLQEALYHELMALIEEGKPELFESLRAVVKEIEEEKGLLEGETLLAPPTYH